VKPGRERLAPIKLVGLVTFWSVLLALSVAPVQPYTADALENRPWRAVAPGKVEPASGEIKILSAMLGRVADVLVDAGEQVFSGELLVRLDEADARARLVRAQAQFAMQKRARNGEAASGKAAQRRKAEDAVVDAENAIFEAQSALDLTIDAKRRGVASQAAVDEARAILGRRQDTLKEKQAGLRKIEAQSGMPLPTPNEGQFNVARAELLGAQAALEKMRIRAPIDGRVLQVNAKMGEPVGPSSAQYLLLLGDVSKLRVRVEVDEVDFAEIKIGEPVVIRAAAFPDRAFSGKVSLIAPVLGRPRLSTGKSEDTTVVEVLTELADPAPLAVGMKVDVYFMGEAQREPTH
jgi:HlyD family secretion protein